MLRKDVRLDADGVRERASAVNIDKMVECVGLCLLRAKNFRMTQDVHRRRINRTVEDELPCTLLWCRFTRANTHRTHYKKEMLSHLLRT